MKELDKTLLRQLSQLKAPGCPSVAALGDFLDEKGPPEERQAVELHLRSCPSCMNRLIELRELTVLEQEGEDPPRVLVAAVKRLVSPQEPRHESSVRAAWRRIVADVRALGETLGKWISPRFFGEVAAAAAVAIFLVFIGTRLFHQPPSSPSGKEEEVRTLARKEGTTKPAGERPSRQEEEIRALAQLSPPEQQILTSLSLVSPGSDPLRQRLATILETVPATPVSTQTRGQTNIEVYQKAVAATVLVVTDRSLGSGAVIGSTGEVLTNWHVIQGARRVAVIFKPKEGVEVKKELAFAATPIKVDQAADLALLQIQAPPPDLTVLSLGDLSQVQVGQDVHAIGHPKEQTWTYTTGIVSQVRPQYQWRGAPDDILHQATVIQTQTPINPGNSGGPLLNDQAEIIGINSFRGEGEGLNYAVAVDTIKEFLQKAESQVPPPAPSPAPRPAPHVEGPGIPATPSPPPSPAPSPHTSAYRMEPYGTDIVGVYIDARVPPPDVWLVYRDGRQQPAYAAKGQTSVVQIDTVVQGADPQWRSLVYYFDTNCDGIVDLIGYSTTGDGTIDRYDSPPPSLRMTDLTQELLTAFQQGTIPYSQIRICQ